MNIEKKLEFNINYEFDKETRQRALSKTLAAAVNYDGSKSTAANLDCLKSTALKPAEFRELLKQLLNLRLDSSEMGALVSEFHNAKSEIIADTVNGEEFLKYFLKLGHDARYRMVKEKKNQKLKMEKELKEYEQKKKRQIEEQMELKIDYDFGEVDEARALQKLGNAAKLYDKNHPSAVPLEPFQCSSLPPTVFRDVLRRLFNVNLSPKELGSLVANFDRQGVGMINCQSFLVRFIQMGAELRAQERHKQLESIRKQESIATVDTERNLKETSSNIWDIANIEVTEDVRKSAMQKLRLAACKYDRTHPAALSLQGFEVLTMKPSTFRDMFRRTFNVRLTKAEALAIVQEYRNPNNNTNTNNNNVTSNSTKDLSSSNKGGTTPAETETANEPELICADFLTNFIKIGFEERDRLKSESLLAQRKAEREEKERLQKFLEQSLRVDVDVDFDFQDSDLQSALAKITPVAVKYDRTLPSAKALTSFEVLVMDPAEFNTALGKTFGIRLKPKELGAMVNKFDKSGIGKLCVADFLHFFLKIGIEERGRHYADQLSRSKKLEEEKKKTAELKLKEAEAKIQLQVDPNFTDDDVNSAMEKVRVAAVKYDRNVPGAMSLTAFEGSVMSPTGAYILYTRPLQHTKACVQIMLVASALNDIT